MSSSLSKSPMVLPATSHRKSSTKNNGSEIHRPWTNLEDESDDQRRQTSRTKTTTAKPSPSSELYIDIGSFEQEEEDSCTEDVRRQIITMAMTNDLDRIAETYNDNILFTHSADSESAPCRPRDNHKNNNNTDNQHQEQQQSPQKTATLTELYMDIIEENQETTITTTPIDPQKMATRNDNTTVETPTHVEPLSAEWLQEWLSPTINTNTNTNTTAAHDAAAKEDIIKPRNMENTLLMEENRTDTTSYEVVIGDKRSPKKSTQPQPSILEKVLASTLTTSTPPPTRSILKTSKSKAPSSSFRQNNPKSTPDTLPATPDSDTELNRSNDSSSHLYHQRTKITEKNKINSSTKQAKEETRKALVSSFSDAIIGNTSSLYSSSSSSSATTTTTKPTKSDLVNPKSSKLPLQTTPNRSVTPEQLPDRIRAVKHAESNDENNLARTGEKPNIQSPNIKKDTETRSLIKSGQSVRKANKNTAPPSKSSIHSTKEEKASEIKSGNNPLVFSGLGHKFAPDGSSVVFMVESKRRSWCEQQIQATRREWNHYNKWLQDNVREVVRIENTVRITYQALEDYADAMEAICEDMFVDNDGNLLTQKEKINLEKKRALSSSEQSTKSSPFLEPIVESYSKLKNELRTYVPLLADDLREASSLRELISASANDIEAKLNAIGLEEVEKAEANVRNAAKALTNAVKWHESTDFHNTIPPVNVDVLDRWLLEAQYRNAAHVEVLIWKENRRMLQAIYKEIVELDVERSRRMRQLLLSFLPKRRKFMESAHSSLLPAAQDLAKAKIDSQKESEAIEKTIEAIALTAIQNCGDSSALAGEGDFEAPGSEWNSPFVKETFIFDFKVDTEWKLSVAVVTVDDFLHVFVLTEEDLRNLGGGLLSVEDALPYIKMSPTLSISLEECEVDFLVDSMTEMELRRSVRSKLRFRKQSDEQFFIKFKDREEAAEKFAYLRSVGKKKSPQHGEDDL